MPAEKNRVVLSEAETNDLAEIVKRGDHSRRTRQRAPRLLWSANGKTDIEIGELLAVNLFTVAKARERWVKERRIADATKSGLPQKLNGKQEAFVVALACSDAPEGRESWTLQWLTDKLVELQVMDEPVSYETIRTTLKKTTLSRGKRNSGATEWCIPTVSAEFVWRMEEVLELSAES